MRFDLITIFPEFFGGPLDHGIIRRAREAGLVDVQVQDLREFTKDRHRSVDDRPLSGGELPAMLVVDAVTRLLPGALGNEASSQNESFSEFEAGTPKGPFVRAPSQTDTGKAGNTTNSAARGQVRALLDFPHYTRPADYRGWRVPETLLSGNHREVIKWRQQRSEEHTSELQSRLHLVCRLLLEKKKTQQR